MIFKKKNLLVQLGQYQKGQILFYDKKSKSLLAMNEMASYRPLSQLTLANSYVIGYAILAFISGLFTPQNVLLKLLLLFICQCVMSYYADKLQNLQLKEATFYTVDITVFDNHDFTKWFVKVRRLIFWLLLGGGMSYILSAIAFYFWGDVRILAVFACASFIESIIICNGMAGNIFLKVNDFYKKKESNG
ncbi:hypothetical protein [Streptococcus mutans]|uniref:hypothetical protein n=2 Tax=Streptococcus mutans TaxID=1309 RepID=UPI0014559F5E|nr:hypothetical protein [Streptococcus mutans]NLQ49527.1 hypothetical protein [Streptococcus mutans]